MWNSSNSLWLVLSSSISPNSRLTTSGSSSMNDLYLMGGIKSTSRLFHVMIDLDQEIIVFNSTEVFALLLFPGLFFAYERILVFPSGRELACRMVVYP